MDKEKKPLGRIRKPMYETGDGVMLLKYVADIAEDAKLKEIALKIEAAHNEMREHLNANYIWD